MRIGESVWYCKKLSTPTADGNDYSAPIEIKTRLMHFTVMDKSGYLDIQEFGNDISKYATAIAQPYRAWVDTFGEGDLFYINGAKPSADEEFYGQNANFVVDNIDKGNIRLKITLKKVNE